MVKSRLPTKIRTKESNKFNSKMLQNINYVIVREDPGSEKAFYEFGLENLESDIRKEEYLIIGALRGF